MDVLSKHFGYAQHLPNFPDELDEAIRNSEYAGPLNRNGLQLQVYKNKLYTSYIDEYMLVVQLNGVIEPVFDSTKFLNLTMDDDEENSEEDSEEVGGELLDEGYGSS